MADDKRHGQASSASPSWQRDAAPIYLPTRFRTTLNNLHREATPIPEIHGQQIYHSQAVSAFLSAFIPDTVPKADRPQRMQAILDNVQSIWQEHGPLPVDQLASKLIAVHLAHLPKPARDFLNEQIKTNYNSREHLTGQHKKEFTPLLIGFAHLYGLLTNKPVTLAYSDIGNMQATNEHHRKLQGAAQQQRPEEIDEDTARTMTDDLVRVLVNIPLTEVRASLPGHLVEAARLGGDEGLMVIYADEAQVQAALNKAVPKMDEAMAKAGALYHEHSKGRDEPARDGMNLAIVTVPVTRDVPLHQALKQVDARIDDEKQYQGAIRSALSTTSLPMQAPSAEETDTPSLKKLFTLAARCGYLSLTGPAPDRLTPALRRQLTNHLRQDGVYAHDEPPHDDDLINQLQLEVAARLAQQRLETRDHLKQVAHQAGADYSREPRRLDLVHLEENDNGTLKETQTRGSEAYGMEPETARTVLAAFNALISGPDYGHLKAAANDRSERRKNRTSILFATPLELTVLRFHQRMKLASGDMSPADQTSALKLLASFTPEDPSSGAHMETAMPGILARFAADTETLRTHLKSPQGALLQQVYTIDTTTLNAQAMRVSFLGLSGLNAKLGHENADLILQHFHHKILRQAYIESGAQPNGMEIAHEGGANFDIALRPIQQTNSHNEKKDSGNLVALDPKFMETYRQLIGKKLDEFGRQNVADFIRSQKGHIPDDLDANLTFADIKDPRREGRKALGLAIVNQPIKLRDDTGRIMRGGRMLDQLKKAGEAEIKRLREAPAVTPPPGRKSSTPSPA